MRKTILTLAMTSMMALAATAAPTIESTPNKSKTNVEFKGDTLVINDGDEQVTVSGLPEMQKVRDRINRALDDTLTTGSGTTVEIGDSRGELAPEDIKEISNQWASVVKQMAISGSFCLLGLVGLVLFFRYLNRRNKYRVIERAIENNYPLDELSLGDVKRSAIYVQQPVVQVPPVAGAVPPQHDSVPVGKPLEGQRAASPVVIGNMVNWRALMPAIKWVGWGVLMVLFSIAIGNGGEDPFWPVGLALIVVGVSKGFILYKEQQALQQAWQRAQQRAAEPRRAAMGEGAPVPPPADEDYRDEDNNTYQPY